MQSERERVIAELADKAMRYVEKGMVERQLFVEIARVAYGAGYKAGLEEAAKIAEKNAPVTQDWEGTLQAGMALKIAAAIRAFSIPEADSELDQLRKMAGIPEGDK